LGNGRGAL